MNRIKLMAFLLLCALPLAAQEGKTKRFAEKMLAEMTTSGEKVVIDREVTVRDEYGDYTFEASSSASGYNVVLAFPYSSGFTDISGVVDYGNQARQLPFKLTKAIDVAYLYLKVPSKPGETAHLRFKCSANMMSCLCRLMVVEYH